MKPVVLEMALGICQARSDPLEFREPRDLVQLASLSLSAFDLHSIILHPVVCLLVMQAQVSANFCVSDISLSLSEVDVAILILDPFLRLYSSTLRIPNLYL